MFRKPSLLSAAVSGALGATGVGIVPSAYAQSAGELEEVVVTGSRISRRDYDSNSPIVTVNAADFETQTGLNIESYLNQLPEYNPANSPVATGAGGNTDVQVSPINSVGIASISLRGFGPNRSLVLVNGKRPTPVNPLMVTDINGIPSALISRVETISGGASAVYGADAVAGVTNFILRDNFEGVELDMQTGQIGDGSTENRLSAVMGANMADGRGNVTVGMERYDRDAVLRIDNDFYVDFRGNALTAGDAVFNGLQGINQYRCLQNCAPAATYENLFGGANVFSPLGANVNRVYNFNSDGTLWVAGSQRGMSRYTGSMADGEYFPLQLLDAAIPPGNTEFTGLKWHDTRAFASAPQERTSFFASGNFDITDDISIYARATFAESNTRTTQFGFNTINGWEAAIAYDPTRDSPVDPTLDYTDGAVVRAVAANPGAFPNPGFIPTGTAGAHFPVPVDLAILLNGRPQRTAPWVPQWNPDDSIPPRNTDNTNSVWQLEAGLNFPMVGDWTGEFYVSQGVSATDNISTGHMSLGRYRMLSNLPDYARNSRGTGNLTYLVEGVPFPVQAPGTGSGDFTCTSGLYATYFGGDQPMSQDCFDALTVAQQTRTQNQQDIIEVNLQGPLFRLPAGEIRAAAGFQNRENSSQFYPDSLLNADSFQDQYVGLLPVGELDASTSVDDYYFEALLPVVSGRRFAQSIELELGARYSDYEHTEEETTWKLLANWRINDRFRIRGGVNRATRAPNLGEFFLNRQELFSFAFGPTDVDACGLRSLAPFGAGGALPDPILNPGEPQTQLAAGQTPEGAASTLLICQMLMGGVGSPGATQFYEVANAGAGAFPTVGQVGNPQLVSETADTWTLGFVTTWESGLTLSFDAYRIEIEDAISVYSNGWGQFLCYGGPPVTSEAEAQERAASLACQRLPRETVNGASLGINVSYDNLATIKTQGFDIALNWFGDVEALRGRLSANLQATVLDYYKTKATPNAADIEIDFAGSLGPTLPGTNAGAYDYRLFGSLTYGRSDWSVGLRWRHLPEVYSAAYATQKAIIANNAAVAGGAPGTLLTYNPMAAGGILSEIPTDSYNIFDLSLNWNISDTWSLRAGVNNLFDTDPVYTNRSSNVPADTVLANVCPSIGSPPGCQNPAAFALPSGGAINGGYYDIFGRRYFLGIKVAF